MYIHTDILAFLREPHVDGLGRDLMAHAGLRTSLNTCLSYTLEQSQAEGTEAHRRATEEERLGLR